MRERTKSAHANGEFIALLATRTYCYSHLFLRTNRRVKKRCGCTARRKYSFKIDQSSEPKAFASIVCRCSDRLFSPVEFRLLSCAGRGPGWFTGALWASAAGGTADGSVRSSCLFRNSDTLRANTHTKLKWKWTETRRGISSWVSANRLSRISP